MVTASQFPIPPADLRFLVSGANLRDNPDLFLPAGKRAYDMIAGALSRVGEDIQTYDAVLDWGCGCGRIIRHFVGLPNLKTIAGCDINADLIEWSQEHLPFGDFYQSALLPPLKYRDASFDLVYGCSVITHLGLETQFAWMRELWRVLKPGGVAILTYHGEHYIAKNIKRIINPVEIGGGLFGDLSDGPEGSNQYGSIQTAQALGAIFAPFDIVETIPRHFIMGKQDTAILRKGRDTALVTIANTKIIAGESAPLRLALTGQKKINLFFRAKMNAPDTRLRIRFDDPAFGAAAYDHKVNLDQHALHQVTLELPAGAAGSQTLRIDSDADGAVLYGTAV